MSLRARLSLVTVVVAALALIAANLAIYQLVADDLETRFDERIASLAGPTTGFLLLPDRDVVQTPGFNQRLVQSPNGEDLTGVYSELRSSDGTVLASGFAFTTDSKRKPPRIPDARMKVKPGTTTFFDTTAPSRGGDVSYRVRVSAMPDGGVGITALPTKDLIDTEHRIVLIQSLVSLGVVLIGLVITWLLVGLGLRPLRRIGATAERIAEGDLAQRVEPSGSRTEIQRLGSSLNGMLSEIETAFAAKETSERTLRQFVADASHELRTPITSIRGYAELLRRGADAEPAERLTAARRIEQEARRMGHLVEELLLLARLDEGAPLVPQPLDVVRLAQDLAQDARVVDPTRTIRVDAPASLVISADREGLTQVLSNLLANARIHTPDGTPIELQIQQIDAEVEVRVVDHGPGIDAAVGQQVFDRFWRADTERSPTSGASGLGLAIVAAIVSAHRGQYSVADTPGGGATFRIRVPIDDARESINHSNAPSEVTSATETSATR